MRIFVLAALAALTISSASLAAEKDPNQVLVLGDANHPNEAALDQFAERVKTVNEHNTKLYPAPAVKIKSSFILWLDENDHLMVMERVSASKVSREILARTPADGLTPYVVPDTSALFALAQKALDSEEPAETAEELGLPGFVTGKLSMFADRWSALASREAANKP